MNDLIIDSFLALQFATGMELASQSDVLDLMALPSPGASPTHFIARFRCRGVVRQEDGQIGPVDGQFHVGIAFQPDHLRRVHPMQVMTWIDPPTIVHPNILAPAICCGRVNPGVELVDLLYHAFEIITYTNWASHDALNSEAAEWARHHQHLFPVDRRPLKRLRATGPKETRGQGGPSS